MKVAHITSYAPHTNGLYESSRDIVAAVRATGADARLVDCSGVTNGTDRGVPLAPLGFVNEAAVVVKHTGLGPIPEDVPIINVLHGTPYHTFFYEINHLVLATKAKPEDILAGYVLSDMFNRDRRFKWFVTLWPEHLPYWEQVFDADKLRCLPAPCDQTIWKPDGPKAKLPGDPVVVSAATWRRGIEPFHLIVAFRHWAKHHNHPDARLHVYGTPTDVQGLRILGGHDCKVIFHPKVSNLDEVYRAADLVLVPHKIATRAVREALSCGCTIVGPTEYAGDYCHDPESTESFAFTMEQAVVARRSNQVQVQRDCVDLSKDFAPEKVAKAWLKLYEEVA